MMLARGPTFSVDKVQHDVRVRERIKCIEPAPSPRYYRALPGETKPPLAAQDAMANVWTPTQTAAWSTSHGNHLWPARDLSSMASNSALRHMPGSLMSCHDESRLQVYLAASGILVPAGLESARRRRDTASKHWVAFARHSRRRRMVTRSGRYTLPCLLLCAVLV